jgi:hypothetical protein
MPAQKPVFSRIYQPKDIILWRAPPQQANFTGSGRLVFMIPTPSARVVQKIAIFFWPNITGQSPTAIVRSPPLTPVDPTVAGSSFPITLNLFTGEQAETGWVIPTSDLVGSLLDVGLPGIGNGQQIPLGVDLGHLGLGGFTLDVQGGQSFVGGIFFVGTGSPYLDPTIIGINATLRVRYEVVATEMCDDEWEALKPQMQPSLFGAPLVWF